jgi:hypothetical protein
MDRERAETCLRLLAEAELRHATRIPAHSTPGRWHSARLGIDGHGISVPPNEDLPERWRSLLTPPPGREPRAPSAPGMLAAAVAELPELDGAQITIMGLHHGERGTIMHLLVSGVTLEDDWAYARGSCRCRAIGSGPGHAAAQLAVTITLGNGQGSPAPRLAPRTGTEPRPTAPSGTGRSSLR